MRSERALRTVEFVFWVAFVAGTVVAVALALGFATGEGLLGAKYVLFLVGFLTFGLGSLAIQPASPDDGSKRVTLSSDDEARFEAALQELPPLRDGRLPVDRRVGRNVKLFVTSLVVLAVSAVLEIGLGVTV